MVQFAIICNLHELVFGGVAVAVLVLEAVGLSVAFARGVLADC